MIRARKENCRGLVKLRNETYLAWLSRKDDFLKKQHLRGKGAECCRQMNSTCKGRRQEEAGLSQPLGLARLACVRHVGGWAGAGVSPCKTSWCLFSCNRAPEGVSHSVLTMPLARKNFCYVCFTDKETKT